LASLSGSDDDITRAAPLLTRRVAGVRAKAEGLDWREPERIWRSDRMNRPGVELTPEVGRFESSSSMPEFGTAWGSGY